VTASDLLDSGIIDKDTLADLVQGSKTVQEVTQMASVRRYLDGTGCIAGVLVPSKADPSKMEKMSIYAAMWKGILRQGTALVLLEAQAATGFMVDPLTNQKLSVDEAVSCGLVGSELHEKLLSAERAVTGYTDPYTDAKISLFQAMKKELIVKEHGIRLLEAQIATGGIIDPVHSHRLPVEAAYQRGYFDEEMSQVLSDPSDDTKGFFDPNTHENLTYMQLLRRCVPDPDTGLLMLQLMDKGSVLYQLSEDARQALQAARTSLSVGLFQGQSVTVWELLFSRYVPDHRRQDLLRRYKVGTLTINEMITILSAIVAEAEGHGAAPADTQTQQEALAPAQNGDSLSSRRERELEAELELERSLKSYSVQVSVGSFQGRKVSLWELLFSKYVCEAKRLELLAQVKSGSLALEQLAGLLTGLVQEAEKRSSTVTFKGLRRQGSVLYQLNKDARKALQAARTSLSVGLFQGQSVTVWELLFSRYVPDHQREELLRKYKAGTVTIPELITLLTTIITGAEMENGDLGSSTVTPNNEVGASQPVPDTHSQEQQLRKSLKSATICVTAGEFQGHNVSLLDLLFSKYVPQGRRQELLELYRAGILTTEQVATVVTTIINRTEAANATLVANARSPHKAGTRAGENGDDFSTQDEELDNILKSTTIDMAAGELQGRQVAVWDLLFSEYIPEEKRQELLQLYHERILTLEQIITVVTAVIKKKESTSRKFLISVKTSNKDTVSEAGEKGDDSAKEEPWETALKTTVIDMEVGDFQGQKVSVWDLLHSKYIPEESRKELLELYQAGELTLEQVKTVVTTIVTKTEAAKAEELTTTSSPRAASPVAEAEDTSLQEDRTWEDTLRSTAVEVPVDGFQGRQGSVWDLLFSRYIPEGKRQELLQLYRAGTLALEQLPTRTPCQRQERRMMTPPKKNHGKQP
ncbi:hypothetical protein A306_00000456, partial [Columba livia]